MSKEQHENIILGDQTLFIIKLRRGKYYELYFLSYNIQHAEDTGKSSHRRAFDLGVEEAGALKGMPLIALSSKYLDGL